MVNSIASLVNLSMSITSSKGSPAMPDTAAPPARSRALEMFQQMQKSMLASLPEEDRQHFQRLGEKFHSSFDITKGEPIDLSTICMEEALAYVVESLKSGLHPSYLTDDEKALLRAGYGDEWFTQWGYQQSDVDKVP